MHAPDIAAFIPDPEQTHRRVPDDMAEYLGETFVRSATTGNDDEADAQDTVLPEEIGGPFIETEAATEFGATMTRATEFEDEATLPEAFPTAIRADAEPALEMKDPAERPDGDSDADEVDDDDDDDVPFMTAPPPPPPLSPPHHHRGAERRPPGR
ncbi:MAG: hypothetical protein ABUR63_07965 [Verrucomicrobiota bacterium]